MLIAGFFDISIVPYCVQNMPGLDKTNHSFYPKIGASGYRVLDITSYLKGFFEAELSHSI